MADSIMSFLADDHARLDACLEKASRIPGQVDLEAFELFRKGLLRHIALEEKVLLPAAKRVLGEQIADFSRIRADHGRFTLMLVPTPTWLFVEELKAQLAVHNEIEERPGGVYDQCAMLLADQADEILRKMRDYPEVPTRPHNDAARPIRA